MYVHVRTYIIILYVRTRMYTRARPRARMARCGPICGHAHVLDHTLSQVSSYIVVCLSSCLQDGSGLFLFISAAIPLCMIFVSFSLCTEKEGWIFCKFPCICSENYL